MKIILFLVTLSIVGCQEEEKIDERSSWSFGEFSSVNGKNQNLYEFVGKCKNKGLVMAYVFSAPAREVNGRITCQGEVWSGIADLSSFDDGEIKLAFSLNGREIYSSSVKKEAQSPSPNTVVNFSPGSGQHDSGVPLTLTVTFSEEVVVTGTPHLQLNFMALGGNSVAKYATYSSTSGREVAFIYRVIPGDSATSVALGNGLIELNGGTITDGAGNPAVLTATLTADLNGVGVSTEPPILSSVSSLANSLVKNGDSAVTVTATFNEAVTVTGSPTLQFMVGVSTTATATFLGTVGVSSATHDFLYTPGGGDGEVRVTGITGGQIRNGGNHDVARTQLDVSVGNLLVDNTPPTVTGVEDDNQVRTSKIWAWGCDDGNGCTYRFVVDTTADTEPSGSFTSVTTATEDTGTGRYYLHVQAQDLAGNPSPVRHLYVDVDNTPPTVTGVEDDNQVRTSKTWAWGCDDGNGCTYRFVVDTTADTEPSGSFTSVTTATEDTGTGRYYLHVQAQDLAGNPSPVRHLYVDVDNTPPTVTGVEDDNQVRTSKTWAWGCDDGNGCTYRFVVDTTADTEPSGSFTSVTTATEDTGTGRYYLHVQAQDLAGNPSPVRHLYVDVDNTPPTVTGVEDDNQVRTSKTWAWGCDDGNGCTYRFVVDTTADTEPSGSFTSVTTATEDTGTGRYYLHVQAQDLAGNLSPVRHLYVDVDNEVATISSVTSPRAKTYGIGEKLDFLVTFSEDVTVTGAPQLALNLQREGSAHAHYLTGSGSRTLTFRYQVAEGDLDRDGIELANGAMIDLNNGRIAGGADVDALISALAFGDLNLVKVDAVKPRPLTAFASTGPYKKGAEIDLRVTFDEPVQVGLAGTLVLEVRVADDTLQVDFTGDRGTLITELAFTYTVRDNLNGPNGIEVRGVNLKNGATIEDESGNHAVGLQSFNVRLSDVTIDSISPTVSITDFWQWSCGSGDSCTYRYYVGPETPMYTLGDHIAYGMTTTATPLARGSSYVYVQARDVAGNESTVAYAGPVVNLDSAELICGDQERPSGFNGGAGTAASPYLICSYAQLQRIRNNLNGYYKLGKSLKATSNWTPVGNSATPFQGQLDGNGHTIANLQINGTGFFGATGSSARISGLGLVDASITTTSGGGLVGENQGVMGGCFVKGTVISTSTTTNTVVGGLVGNNRGIIFNSYSLGSVTATTTAGGLAGSNEGAIVNSYSMVEVSAPTAGGLVGSNGGHIANSYATGVASSSSANSYSGGLVGLNESDGSIQNSYATGEPSASTIKGGLVGKNQGSIANCYSLGGGALLGSNSGTLQGSNYFVGSGDNTEEQIKALASASGWTTGNWNFGSTSEFPRVQYTQWDTQMGDECGGNTGVSCGKVIQGQFGDNLPPKILTDKIRLPLMPYVLPDHTDSTRADLISRRTYHYRKSSLKVEYYDEEGDSVTFGIESQTANNAKAFCSVNYYANPVTKRNIPELGNCRDLVFAINPEGYIYIKDQRVIFGDEGWFYPTHDFKEERLIVTLTESDTGHVTRKEISILPSLRINDCSAHTVNSVAEYECLYLQELPALAQNSDDPTLRPHLPNQLVQPKENYRLVFREEFNGEGFDSLDKRLWSTFEQSDDPDCRSTISGGYFAFTQDDSRDCPPHKISTAGKFEHKFGYLEMKLRLPIKRQDMSTNFAFVLWSRFNLFGSSFRSSTFSILNKYNLLHLDNLKLWHRYIGGEMDLMEYSGRVFYFGGGNGNYHAPSYDVILSGVTNQIAFCSKRKRTDVPAYFDWWDQGGICNTQTYDESLVTLYYGYEWTPGGVKWLYKIDGIHDDWQLYSIYLYTNSNVYSVQEKQLIPPDPEKVSLINDEVFLGYNLKNNGNEGNGSWADWQEIYYDSVRDLLKMGIQHLPGFLEFVNWGDSLTNQNRTYVDYLRIFQPVDKYSSIPPVYQ